MKKPVVTHRLWANNTATNLMANKEQKQQPATGAPEPVATCRVALDSEEFESGEVLAWAGPDEADPAFVSWQHASGAVPTQVAIELAGTPAELVAWMVPLEVDANDDLGYEAGEITAKLAELLAIVTADFAGPVLQPEPKPAPGFEGLNPAEELKRFFDLVDIGANGFVISTRYAHRSRDTGEWIESWSHYYAIRYGDGGNADLYDYLRYGQRTPSDKGKNNLLNRFSQKDNDKFRSTNYYIRTAEFKKDPVDGKVRSYEKEYVKWRRTYSVESDEGTLAQQQERIASLKG